MIAAIPIEDVVNYDNSRLLQVTFAKCPDGIDPTQVVMSLTHSYFEFVE